MTPLNFFRVFSKWLPIQMKIEYLLVNPLHPTRISVWCAISSRGSYGPCFIEGNLNSQNYKSLLEKEFIPFCQGMDCLDGYWFMQDGARPPSYSGCFSNAFGEFWNSSNWFRFS